MTRPTPRVWQPRGSSPLGAQRHRRPSIRVAGGVADRLQERAFGVGLGHHGVYARDGGRDGQQLAAAAAVEDDPRARRPALETQRQGEAVLAGMVDVEDQDRGVGALQQPLQVRLVVSRADRDHAGRRAHDRLQAGADGRVVVEHRDSDQRAR